MTNFQPRGISRKPMREVRDTRKPLYIIFVLDTSSSMNEPISIDFGEGNITQKRKIEELNEGFGEALNSLRHFEANNVMYRIYYQIIELNSYGKALFPDFVPLSLQSEQICFEANGVTCLENSISTLKKFLNSQHMPGCNRAANVILMSDGYPTDVEGYVLEESVYQKTVGDFKNYLKERGLKPNVDLYSIGVGEGACEEMLSSFADEGRYYVVKDLESLAQKLDFVTRQSLNRLTTRMIRPVEQPTNEDGKSLIDTPVAIREIDVSKCLGASCERCLEHCAVSAIQNRDGLIMIQPELCIGCGNCDNKCPVGAIRETDSTDLGDWL